VQKAKARLRKAAHSDAQRKPSAMLAFSVSKEWRLA
jgi:hypothetical protein